MIRIALTALVLGLAAPVLAQDGKAPDKPAPKKDPKSPDDKSPEAKPAKAKAPEPKPIAVEGELGQAKALFPFLAGKSLRYQLKVWTISQPEDGEKEPVETESPRRNTVIVKVKGEEKIEGVPHTVLAYFLNGELQQQEFYRVEDEGLIVARRIFGAEKQALPFDLIGDDGPPLILKSAMKKGDTWVWKGRIGRADNVYTVMVLGGEIITIDEKEYKTLKVVNVVESSDESKATARRWYSPGIGLVREVTEVVTGTETIRTETILQRIEPIKKKKD